MWDWLKSEIRFFSINYSWEKWRQFPREKILIINRLSLLKRQLASENPAVKSEILTLESILKQLYDRQLEGSKIRSRAKWLEEGETPHAKSFISSVYNSAAVEVSSLPEMMEAHK